MAERLRIKTELARGVKGEWVRAEDVEPLLDVLGWIAGEYPPGAGAGDVARAALAASEEEK